MIFRSAVRYQQAIRNKEEHMKTTYLLRITKELKESLNKQAKEKGVSTNALIIVVLDEYLKRGGYKNETINH